ncbi:MAG: ATPase [Dehalococcoidia bacterium]|nr:MAG: ATPase [Dehalococcoidia bacterium]
MVATKNQQPDTSDREIVATRVFDAPRELVWDAFTQQQHIAQWFGPRGFTTTTDVMDVRPGGRWTFIMHGPDGVDYDNEVDYVEVVRPERLVYVHGPVPRFDVTVTLAEDGQRTHLTMRSVFESAAVRQQVIDENGALEGARQTLERLAEFLAGGVQS